MRQIINFMLRTFTSVQVKELGRWNIVYCQNQINTKIDLANLDHCGTCGLYTNTNITANANTNTITNTKKQL